MAQVVSSNEGSIEDNFRITNNIAFDMNFGKRVRFWQILHGISKEQLGTELNIASHKMHKYKCGAILISAEQ